MAVSETSLPNEFSPAAAAGLPKLPWAHALLEAWVIVAVTSAVYLPALHGGFLLDDDMYLTKNTLITGSDNLHRFWFSTSAGDYYPVSNTTLWLEWRLWGMNPTPYHVVNLLLHIAAALVLLKLLRKLSIPGAFPAALLFALHPVNVESVAWIAQRKGVLALVFFLLSILWYLSAEEEKSRRGEAQIRGRFGLWYGLSFLAFVLAMLSKGSVAVLPLVLLLIVWWQRRRIAAVDLLRTAPFFVVAVVLTWVNVWFQTRGADVVIREATFGERSAGAGAAIWFYLGKSFLPVDLILVYPQWRIATRDLLWWLPLLAVAAVTIALWRQRNSPSASWSRPVLFAWLYFCVSLVPILGFTDVGFMEYSLVADHYQHLAVIGVVALGAAAWVAWSERASKASRVMATPIALIVLGTLAFLSWQQSRLFGDPIQLYQVTLEKNPKCALIHNNLGIKLSAIGRREEGVRQYEEALRLNPAYGLAYINLGNALSASGRTPEAIQCYRQALRLTPDSPEAHNNLGDALNASGNVREAVEHYHAALKLQPSFAEAYNNLGVVLEKAQALQAAIDQYQQALRWRPAFPEAHSNLAHALLQVGRTREAVEHYQEALRLAPDSPASHNNLGLALLNAAQPRDAMDQFQRALQLQRDYAVAHANLALALDQLQRPAEALAAAQTALDLARSQKQQGLVQELEEWLKKYRSSHPDLPVKSPAE